MQENSEFGLRPSPQNAASTAQPAGMEQGITWITILTELARRKSLIARVTGVAILLGIVLALLLPAEYTATTKIMPPQQSPSAATVIMSQMTGGAAGSLAALAGGGLGLHSPNDIYIGLLQSRPVADAIIGQFDLERLYHAKDMTATRKILAERTVISSEKSGLIAISVNDRDKKRVANMAKAYVDGLRNLTKSLAVTEASQRRAFYEEQLNSAKDALVLAENDFQQVEQKKGLISLDAQAKSMIESLALLRAQVAAKEVQVEALRSYSTEQNPEVQLAEKELGALQGEQSRFEQRNHSSGFADMGLADVPNAGLDYLRAQHEVLYRQTLLDLLVKQYDAARLDEAKEVAVIQVVDQATEPDRRSSPHRTIIVLILAGWGIIVGCIWVALERWNEGMKANPATARRLEALKDAMRLRRQAKA